MKSLEKFDKFYIVLSVILILMAVLLVFTFRGIFSAYLEAYEIDQTDIGMEERVDNELLDNAYNWAFNKQSVILNIKE